MNFPFLPHRNPQPKQAPRHTKRSVVRIPGPAGPTGDMHVVTPAPEPEAPTAMSAPAPWLVALEFPPASDCKVCADLDYRAQCACKDDCGHCLCIAGPAGAEPPAIEPASAEVLAKVRDRLRALPAGKPEQDTVPPAAWLRAIIPGRPELLEPLGEAPVYAGSDRTPSGVLVAGCYFGTNEDGWFIVDTVSPSWCDDAITALTAMRDRLVSAAAADSEDEAAEEVGAA